MKKKKLKVFALPIEEFEKKYPISHPDAGSVLLAVKEVVEGQCKTSISIGVITSQASMVHRSKRRWYLHPSRSRHL